MLQQFLSERPVPPSESSWEFLGKLGRLLKEADFTTRVLNELFPDTTLTGRDVSRISGYQLSIQESDKLAHKLARFWLLREAAPKAEWFETFGEEFVRSGVACGMIRDGDTHCQANFDIQPCLGDSVLTDPKFRHPWESDQVGVYYLGSDSYALVNTVPRTAVGECLDLFTGSGVHAILAARHGACVVGVDINPRAVEMATANAHFNGVQDRCRFVQSDLFSAVEGRTFDLITANPPFVPTPDQSIALYRSGGESGEALTAKVLNRLHEFLNPGGTMMMVTNYPCFAGTDVVDHHRSMLGAPDEFGIALLHCYLFPREAYIQMHLTPTGDGEKDQAEVARWLDCYRKQEILGIGFGVLYFHKIVEGAAWSAMKESDSLVRGPLGDEVGDWLEGLRLFGDGRAFEEDLRFNSKVRLMVDQDDGTGLVRWNAPTWPDVTLNRNETETAVRLKAREKIRWDDGESNVMTKLGREGLLQPVSS
jgi:SAM-dependent methyltransferase